MKRGSRLTSVDLPAPEGPTSATDLAGAESSVDVVRAPAAGRRG